MEALEAVLDDVERSGIGELWCLGDVVGNGHDPVGCLDRVEARCRIVLAGNHEVAIAGPRALPPAVEFSRSALARAGRLDGLARRASEHAEGGVRLAHGCPTPFDPVRAYLREDVAPGEVLDACPEELIVVGHTHRAETWRRGRQWLVDVGSVGEPRDGDARPTWFEIEWSGGSVSAVREHRVAFDPRRYVGSMLAAGLDLPPMWNGSRIELGEGGSAFAPGVAAWRRSLGNVRDVVRQELVARQLRAHLPDRPLEVLDAGCGQGTQAVRLARLGHRVVGLDLSEDLLEDARRSAEAEAPEVRERLDFRRGDVLEAGERLPASFDVVCCHGVLMYLPSLAAAIASLAGAARPGALLSVLTRNRAGLAMRAGMSGEWEAATAAFDANRYANRLGLEDLHAHEPAEVADALRATGAQTVAWYGVRLFTDHWPAGDPPADLPALLRAEEEAGRRDPYRSVAALTHTLARAA